MKRYTKSEGLGDGVAVYVIYGDSGRKLPFNTFHLGWQECPSILKKNAIIYLLNFVENLEGRFKKSVSRNNIAFFYVVML